MEKKKFSSDQLLPQYNTIFMSNVKHINASALDLIIHTEKDKGNKNISLFA